MLQLLPLLALSALSAPSATPARSDANLGSYFSDNDYPPEAIRNGEQGTVSFRLDVSPEGMVAGCTVAGSSGSATLDAATCRILSERARFSPAKDAKGAAVADSVSGRIRWVLPEGGSVPLETAMRAINNVWEVTADGRQRSCRRELRFEGGEQANVPVCLVLDGKFVRAAAAYLGARPEEILTVRLENRWMLDPVLPFSPPAGHVGGLLVRGEGDYRLNDDLSVRNCVAGLFSARFAWRPDPCFRKSFSGVVPAGSRQVRLEVQWVVSRGPDTQRPAQLPSFVTSKGEVLLPPDVDRGCGEEVSAGTPGAPAPPLC